MTIDNELRSIQRVITEITHRLIPDLIDDTHELDLNELTQRVKQEILETYPLVHAMVLKRAVDGFYQTRVEFAHRQWHGTDVGDDADGDEPNDESVEPIGSPPMLPGFWRGLVFVGSKKKRKLRQFVTVDESVYVEDYYRRHGNNFVAEAEWWASARRAATQRGCLGSDPISAIAGQLQPPALGDGVKAV